MPTTEREQGRGSDLKFGRAVHLDGEDDGVGVVGWGPEGAVLDRLRPRSPHTQPARADAALHLASSPPSSSCSCGLQENQARCSGVVTETLMTSRKRILVQRVWP